MNKTTAMRKDPKAMEPRLYTKQFFIATNTGKAGMFSAFPPAQ